MSDSSPLAKLSDDELVYIMERLPAEDRMRVEFVNKRWAYLARHRSWTKFTSLTSLNFRWMTAAMRDGTREIDEESQIVFKQKLIDLFIRCAPYLKTIELDEFFWKSEVMCDLLPILPNLVHLKLAILNLSRERLHGYRESFSNLITLIAKRMVIDSIDDVSNALRLCDRLELLSISTEHESQTYPIERLPPNLKCLYLYEGFDPVNVLDVVAKQGIQLSVLSLSFDEMTDEILKALMSIDRSRLNFLMVYFEDESRPHIEHLFEWLPRHLQALSLEMIRPPGRRMLRKMLSALLKKHLPTLEHIKIGDMSQLMLEDKESQELFMRYATVASNLRSIYLSTTMNAATIPLINDVLSRLSSHGKLEYIETDANLPMDVVASILKSCKKLRTIAWCCNHVDFTYLHQIVDDVRQREPLPATPDDERILNVRLGLNDNLDVAPEHPWIKYHSNIPESPIVHKIRYSALSSRPYVI
ncbi:putative uncharacterized F-box/LRR-repeat protein C02F5.7-like [Ditylenchus destructor]|uniref:Uncharacterized F-box/LRR-repeat protein C02F5.7-like n=1 Tax=Ditylenchus destructor TaxID=166010 RepID=A0AAD4NC14_9BILA|nr:putative uncharacterized F-box/LRR-repeat protein C02F5.7-like [Ditylenchus destructor]